MAGALGSITAIALVPAGVVTSRRAHLRLGRHGDAYGRPCRRGGRGSLCLWRRRCRLASERGLYQRPRLLRQVERVVRWSLRSSSYRVVRLT